MSCRERELVLKGLSALMTTKTHKDYDHEVQDIIKKIEAQSVFYAKDMKKD
jgi:hypothetical protein